MKHIRSPSGKRGDFFIWGMGLLPVIWLAAALGEVTAGEIKLVSIANRFNQIMERPFALHWQKSTMRWLVALLAVYVLMILFYYSDTAKTHPGAEYGSAKWAEPWEIDQKYRNKANQAQNFILTQNIRLGMDVYRTRRNLNAVVFGASGTGKTTGYVLPNLLQANCCCIVIDPKGEILREIGDFYEQQSIAVDVIDLLDFKGHYNPLQYAKTEEDALMLAHAVVYGTKPPDAPGGGDNKYWDDCAEMLIDALILYVMYEAPEEERNFSMVVTMIQYCYIDEETDRPNPVDHLFEDLEPTHPAAKQYRSFRIAPGRTRASILSSAVSALHPFNTKRFAAMTDWDDCHLEQYGLEQRALFCVIPDNDTTYNFIITILYSQMFKILFDSARKQPDGRLPVSTRFMMDEFQNVALPNNFRNILSVVRSRNISCDILLQDIAGLKAKFKEQWPAILANCDSQILLGSNEIELLEYFSKLLGKETETVKSISQSKGSHGSSSESRQLTGRELATVDELRMMGDDEVLLLIRGERGTKDAKYNIETHPNFSNTRRGGGKAYAMPARDYMAAAAANVSAAEINALDISRIPQKYYENIHVYTMEEIEEMNNEKAE